MNNIFKRIPVFDFEVGDKEKEFINDLNNKLFWLNIHLSNNKVNFFDYMKDLYDKYKLKRDQIYFGLIQNIFNNIRI